MTGLLFVLAQAAVVDSSPTRVVAAPCAEVRKRASHYVEEHDFYSRDTDGQNRPLTDFQGRLLVEFGNHKDASTPAGKPLHLNRLSIGKYTLHQPLSPMRTYNNFDAIGTLRLEEASPGSCRLALQFDLSGYTYVWALGVIDDGYRLRFRSNGVLERMYLEGIAKESAPKPMEGHGNTPE